MAQLTVKKCVRCGREIVALVRESEPICQHCQPKRKQGLLALLFSLLVG